VKFLKKWLISWNVELQWQSRKGLLLLDCLKNVHLEFLPPNATSLVQPICMGIIKKFEDILQEVGKCILEAAEETLLTSLAARKGSTRVRLLQAAEFVASIWQAISIKTIQNCFADCGFQHLGLNMPNVPIRPLQCVSNHK
jgi:hypothetical protein